METHHQLAFSKEMAVSVVEVPETVHALSQVLAVVVDTLVVVVVEIQVGSIKVAEAAVLTMAAQTKL
jgi:hypothetical protein